jgi:hypothetical protein
MSTVNNGPQIVRSGLVLDLDASSANSYGPIKAEVLVVAGGGGGGMDMGGGGGGGGVIYSSSYAITRGSTITVTVGNGGTGAPAAGTNGQNTGHQYNISATQGGNSVFGSITAIGGGYGGSSYFGYTPNNGYGGNGGSGGGASGYSDGSTGRAGTGSAGQGFNGGSSSGQYYSGGGGGAGGAGSSGPNKPNGGPGVLYPTMSQYYFGGGGGGSAYSLSSGGDGGIGGGGGGAVGITTGGAGLNNGSAGGGGSPNSWANTPGGNAGANTGGGGGGGSHYNSNNKGGDGGSGIVIIRYKGPQKATGGTVTTVGSETVHTFTSSGTFVTGAFFVDLSGNGYNGTLTNGPTFNTSNKGNILFDGSDDEITTSLPLTNFPASSNFTFETWAKITAYPAVLAANQYGVTYQAGVLMGATYYSGVALYWYGNNAGNVFTLYGFIRGADAYRNTSGYNFSLNLWYHCVLVNIGGGTISLFINGTLFSSVATATLPYDSSLAPSAGNIGISKSQIDAGGTVNYKAFGGHVANARAYNRALSAAEISQNYEATKTRFGL